MSMTNRGNGIRTAWRVGVVLTLLLGLLLPAWSVSPVLAQGTLPETAAAAPAGTVLFQAFDLDREGGQWQQTGTLLERVGLPNALELWEAAVLEKGARKGDFTQGGSRRPDGWRAGACCDAARGATRRGDSEETAGPSC